MIDVPGFLLNSQIVGTSLSQLDERYLKVPPAMPPMISSGADALALLESYGLAVDGSSLQAETRTWYSEVRTAGGVVTRDEIAAMDGLIAGLLADGVWPLVDRMAVAIGDGLEAISVPLKRRLGPARDTLVNIAAEHYAPATGIAMTPVRSINTGVDPAGLTVGDSSIHIWSAGIADGYLFGSPTQTPNRLALREVGGSLRGYHGNGTNSINAAGNSDGLLSSSRSANAQTLLLNGALVQSGTAAAGSFAGLAPLQVWPTLIGGTGTYRGYVVAKHLTVGQTLALWNRLAALKAELGWQ